MKGKNVCFIANYGKSEVFDKVAQQLKGCTIYWVTVNKIIYDELVKDYSSSNILFIDKFSILSNKGEIVDSGKYKLNELVHGDRVLRNEKWASEYLSKLSNAYYTFFEKNNIDFAFGEQTWAHEILAHRVLSLNNELNGMFLSPHTVRMPSGRFVFFKDEFQASVYEIPGQENEATDYPLLQAKKPSYLALNDKLLNERSSIPYLIKKAKYFFSERIFESHDPTKPDSLGRALVGFLSYYINKRKFQVFVKEQPKEIALAKKFVLFTLHKQPEASIDNTGRYYENQLEIIKNIWRISPLDTMLYVKEHSNAIGDRGLDFYREIRKFRNVEFVDYTIDSYSLIEKALAVFTISGTIAYEAALMKTPAFTFIPIFFNGLSMCCHVDFNTFRDPQKSLDALINSVSYNEEVDQAYTNWIYRNSYSGIISDPISDPRCVTKENVETLAESFSAILHN